MTTNELDWLKHVVRPTVLTVRKRLLQALAQEKARHWKMRGNHRLGKHFERGFFRGLNHAHDIIVQMLDPKRFRVTAKNQKPKAKSRP